MSPFTMSVFKRRIVALALVIPIAAAALLFAIDYRIQQPKRLIRAIFDDDLDTAKRLADQPDLVSSPCEIGSSDLGDGIATIVSRISSRVTGDRSYYERATPLFFAVDLGKRDFAALLLERHANCNEEDESGISPLTVAILKSDDKMASLLIDHGADVNKPGLGGRSPLSYAAARGDVVIAKVLLEHGAGICQQDSEGYSPLQIALEIGDEDLILLMNEYIMSP